jgi:signal recognition particle receptor subunit beta
MVLYNYQDREITGKIVYFGPHGVGKSTSLRHIYERVDEEARGKLIQVTNEDGKVLQFDFLPVNVGEVTGMKIRFQLITAPGPNAGDAVWQRVLQGADAVVFVADSDPKGLQSNREAYEFLTEQLESCGVDSERIPLIFQLNKRDLGTAVSIEQLNLELNLRRVPWFASAAVRGEGVLETFQTIGRMLLVDIGRRYKEELLRRKREQIQRSQTAGEAVDSEEETRSIRVAQSAAAAAGAPEEEETPTRVVEADEIEAEEAEGVEADSRPASGAEPEVASAPRIGRPNAPSSDSAPERSRRERDASGNGRSTAEIDQADPPGAAPRGAGGSRPARAAAGFGTGSELRAIREELAQLAEQSTRLLETQARLMRRVDELRRRFDALQDA